MPPKKTNANPPNDIPPEDPATENTDVTESEDDLQVIDPSVLGQAVVFRH